MAKKKRKKTKQKNDKYPTLFAYEGSLRFYKDGSMLSLYSQITNDEWEDIVEETVKYKVFIECLKEYAFPELKERWTEEDDYYRLMLEVALSRMRNIDALLVAKYNQEDIKKFYIKMMVSLHP